MSKNTLLYVDDEKINLLIFEQIFKHKYNVITAQNGEEGLAILSQQTNPNIDFVVSDMRMPLMTGLEFIEKARDTFKDKKYFILTGYSNNDEIQEALDSKLIDDYFMKPARFDEIDEAVQESLDHDPLKNRS
jgi:two-component system response regulator (stage 0 sporulation protein F)